MDFLSRIFERLKDDLSVRGLIRLVLILMAVFLLQNTFGFLRGIVLSVWGVIRPFFLGFVIAYILHRPLRYLDDHHISRKITVPVIYTVLIGIFLLLVAKLIPMLFARTSDFINTMISSVQWLRQTMESAYPGEAGAWINTLAESSLDALMDFKALIPSVTSALPNVLTGTFSALLVGLISMIISIFMCFEWDQIRYHIVRFTLGISRRFYRIVFAVNDEITDYLRSMIILMAIRFVEYSLLYLLVGHPDWLILGVATSLSLIVPYVGPTAVNTVGILSALNLQPFNVIMLVVMIVILAQIDEYVITPMVHSHNLNLSPLWILFSIFASSALFKVAGFVLAVPLYLIIRVVIRMNSEIDQEQQLQKENTV